MKCFDNFLLSLDLSKLIIISAPGGALKVVNSLMFFNFVTVSISSVMVKIAFITVAGLGE